MGGTPVFFLVWRIAMGRGARWVTAYRVAKELDTTERLHFTLMIIAILKILGPLRIMLHLLCLCSINAKIKPG